MGALKGDSNSALYLFNLSGYGRCSVAQAILFCSRVLQGVCDGVGYRHCTACEEHEKKCDHQVTLFIDFFLLQITKNGQN